MRASIIAAMLLAACAGPAGPGSGPSTSPSENARPTNPPSPPVTATAPSPTDGTASPSAQATIAATEPDRYPDWLVGRLYAPRAPIGALTELRRIGLPGRVRLPPGSHVLGVIGDRVMTVTPGHPSSIITILSFETGDEVAEVTVEGSGYGRPFPGGIVTERLQVVSALDGSVRTLHDPGPTPDFELPTRVIAVSENGRRLATSICQAGIEDAYNCRPTSIIDIETGDLLDTVDAGPMPVSRFTNQWLLTRSFASVAMVGPNGAPLWDTAGFADDPSEQTTFWSLEILGGRIVATAQGVDGLREVLLRVDPRTGAHRVLFAEPEGEDWRFWTGWSSDEFAVIGHGDDALNGVVGLSCDPCEDAITAGTVNLSTGAFDPTAIHLNLAP